jgi:WD40 repeat protein
VLSGDGRYLASGSDDGTAKVMESATGEQVANVPVGSPVKAITFTNEDNLVLLSADGIVRTLDIGRKSELQYVQSRSGQIVGISPGTQYFTTFNQKIGQDGNTGLEFAINDRKTGNVLRTVQGTSDLQRDNNRIRYSVDEQTVIAVSPDYGIKQQAPKSDQTLFQEPLAGNARAIAISGDGKTVAVATPQSIDIIRSSGAKRRELLNVAKAITIALAFDGNLIAVGSDAPFVSLLDVDTNKEVARLSLDAPLLMAAFSPDGRYLLTFAQDKSLALFPNGGGKALWQRRDLDVSQMSFSHAGHLIAVVGDSQPVTSVLDLPTGRNVATIQNARDSQPVAAAFGPDDSYIDVASDTSVARHSLETDKLIQQTCALLTRNLTEAEWATVSTGTPYTPTCTKP